MAGTFFPLASLFIDLLILIMFFSKKSVKNKETTLYSVLIIVNFIECLFDIIGIFYIRNGGDIEVFGLLQKIDMVMIITWAALMFYYVYSVSFEDVNSRIAEYISVSLVIISSMLTLLFPNVPVITKTTIDSSGVSPEIAYGAIILFALGIIISVIISIIRKPKNIINKKYFPLYALIILAIVGIILRTYMPELIIEPFIMGYVILIMYHTIENPDLRVIEEITDAKNLAEKANRAKSDFLSSMSHEIRTPLNAIVGLSEDIGTFKDQLPDRVIEDSNDIISASHTLLEIVGNILDISKIESSKMEITEVTYNFKEEISTLAKIDAVRIGDKPINFTCNIAEDIPYELIGDKAHMKQIVNNLITNAIKYTEHGNINLTVKCINKDGICNLIITVQDTGRGIKPEDINKLFAKFERLEIERNTTVEGTGLGLAITKSLVEMMGGKINVESRYGEGSMFMAQIPQKISHMSAVNESVTLSDGTEIKNIEGRNNLNVPENYFDKKVLVVDDNKLNLKVARRALEAYVLDIDEACNGQECLDKVKVGNEYDLILMDIMMPVMSGEAALERLKLKPDFNIPVVALTADAVSGAKEKYISQGFVDYIAKPFSKEQIKKKLDYIFMEKVTYKSNPDRWKNADTISFGSEDVTKDIDEDAL